MAIEFSCPKCQHLLRTSEEKAGLSAKCPACGSPIWVPYPHEVQAASPPADDLEFPVPPAAAPDRDAFTSDGPETHPADSADRPQEAAFEAETARVHCPNCAAENDAGDPVCRFCGSSLEGVRPSPPADWSPPPFDVSEIMSTSWRLYTQEIGLLIGCIFLAALPIIAFVLMLAIPIGIAAATLQDQAAVAVIPIGIVAIPLLFALNAAITIGTTRLYLNVAQGRPRSIGDLFFGFGEGRRFIGRTLLIMLASLASVLVATLACCFPVIIVMMCWWPAFYLLIDQDCPGGDAIGRTFEYAKQRLGQVLGVGAIAFGVVFIAGMVPYLGPILQIFATPFAALLTTVGYLRLTEQKAAFD